MIESTLTLDRGNLSLQSGRQPWLITPEAYHGFEAAVTRAAGTQAAQIEIVTAPPALRVESDEAVIAIDGVLLQSVPSWVRFFGLAATGYDELLSQLATAEADPRVQRIRLDVDSPGGQVAGSFAVAEAIAGTSKPIRAVVGSMCCSAAYWLASQADEIVATDPNSAIGSIGVYSIYYDQSAAYEKAGVTAIAIRSGEHKAMGARGVPITEAQIAAVKEEIDGIAAHFIAAVASGRGLAIETVSPLATGRTWLAPQARELNLIDAVRSGAATSQASATAASAADPGETIMDKTEQQTASIDVAAVTAEATAAGADAERAKLAEFKNAFPGDLEFAVGAYESGLTLGQAQSQHALLSARLKAAAVPETTVDGVDGTIGASEAEGNAAADTGPDFMTVVRERAAARGITKVEAMRQIHAEQPALHERYLQGTLAAAKQRGRRVEGSVDRIGG